MFTLWQQLLDLRVNRCSLLGNQIKEWWKWDIHLSLCPSPLENTACYLLLPSVSPLRAGHRLTGRKLTSENSMKQLGSWGLFWVSRKNERPWVASVAFTAVLLLFVLILMSVIVTIVCCYPFCYCNTTKKNCPYGEIVFLFFILFLYYYYVALRRSIYF